MMEVTNNNTAGLVIWESVYQSDTLSAAAAVTYATGTVLGRLSADGKLVAYDSAAGGTGAEVPVAVLANEATFAAAGDLAVNPLISGQIRKGQVIEHGVGVITDPTVIDQLRSMTILALDTVQNTYPDNQ